MKNSTSSACIRDHPCAALLAPDTESPVTPSARPCPPTSFLLNCLGRVPDASPCRTLPVGGGGQLRPVGPAWEDGSPAFTTNDRTPSPWWRDK